MSTFHMKGFALGLALKQRRNASQKSPTVKAKPNTGAHAPCGPRGRGSVLGARVTFDRHLVLTNCCLNRVVLARLLNLRTVFSH